MLTVQHLSIVQQQHMGESERAVFIIKNSCHGDAMREERGEREERERGEREREREREREERGERPTADQGPRKNAASGCVCERERKKRKRLDRD